MMFILLIVFVFVLIGYIGLNIRKIGISFNLKVFVLFVVVFFVFVLIVGFLVVFFCDWNKVIFILNIIVILFICFGL